MAGSHARVSLSTTRGSRPYQCISAYISVNESAGPACRQHTRSGSPGNASGVAPSVTILSRATRLASRKKTSRYSATMS